MKTFIGFEMSDLVIFFFGGGEWGVLRAQVEFFG